MKNEPGAGKLRIIGGKWRGRRLTVADYKELRPTPDRVRETLFNWLRPVIAGARCLDLFSGTGAMGFEALSRGAGSVVMVESNPALVRLIERQCRALEAQGAEIVCADALAWLRQNNDCFNIVFLDPPFREGILDEALQALVSGGHLQPGALVYIESEPGAATSDVGFKEIKQSRAGQVQYRLIEFVKGENNK